MIILVLANFIMFFEEQAVIFDPILSLACSFVLLCLTVPKIKSLIKFITEGTPIGTNFKILNINQL